MRRLVSRDGRPAAGAVGAQVGEFVEVKRHFCVRHLCCVLHYGSIEYWKRDVYCPMLIKDRM